MEEATLLSKINELQQATAESNDHLKRKHRIIKNVCVLGIGFLFTFIAYGSVENSKAASTLMNA